MELLPAPGRRLAALAVLATAAALGATACSAPGTASTPSTPAASSPATAAPMDPGMAMGTATETPGTAAAVTVHIKGFAYSDPGPIAPGATVMVMNMDSQAHTVTADDGSFNAVAGAGQSVTFTAPAKPGTYPYHCQYHSNMHGTLTVK